MKEIVDAENDIPICSEFADDTWDEVFMNQLPSNSSAEAQVSSDEDEEQEVPNPPAKRVKTYKEAIECLEDVHVFLEEKGHTEAATEADML